MKILWTAFAKSELRNIYDHYSEHANERIALNEVEKIAKATLILAKQPEIGQIEELLKGGNGEMRYLVHQSYKIIYWNRPGKNQVEIIDVFHTRQYPLKIKRTT